MGIIVRILGDSLRLLPGVHRRLLVHDRHRSRRRDDFNRSTCIVVSGRSRRRRRFHGAIAMLPALLVIALAEGFAWRSILVYAALGGVLALALGYGLDFGGYVGAPGSHLAREREVLAASGIAGGLVYWLIAGRRAGFWKA